jgi:hypothetical protein
MTLLPVNTALLMLFRQPRRFLGLYRLPLLLLLLGASADAITTLNSLSKVGPEGELHPAQRIVCHVLGTTIGVPFGKLVQVAFVLVVAAWWRPWCPWLMSLCGITYCLAAISNHFVLL